MSDEISKTPVLFLVVLLYHLIDNQCSWYNLYIYAGLSVDVQRT